MDEIKNIKRRAIIASLLTGIALITLILVISEIYIVDPVRRWLYVIISVAVASFMAFFLYYRIFESRLIKYDQCQVIENSRTGQRLVFWLSLIIAVLIIINPLFQMDFIYGLSSVAMIIPATRNISPT